MNSAKRSPIPPKKAFFNALLGGWMCFFLLLPFCPCEILEALGCKEPAPSAQPGKFVSSVKEAPSNACHCEGSKFVAEVSDTGTHQTKPRVSVFWEIASPSQLELVSFPSGAACIRPPPLVETSPPPLWKAICVYLI